MTIKDDNDRLRAGTLPNDPFEGTVPVKGPASAARSPLPGSLPGASLPPAKPALALQGVADFFASCKDSIEYVLEPFVIRGGFVLIMGAPKSGKTWFAAWLAAQVAAGELGKVVFVEEEGSREVLRDRLRPFVAPDPGAFNESLFVLFRKGIRLDSSACIDGLVDACTGASVIVLDPYIALHGQDENDQSQISSVLNGIQQLISRTGAAVVLIHHTRKGDSWDKNSTASASSADARGSGALVGAVDSVIAIRAVATEKRTPGEVRFYVENTDTRVGAPFEKRLAAINLAADVGSLTWVEETQEVAETAELLLTRVLLALPRRAEEAVSRDQLREVLHVGKTRLRDAIQLGIGQRLIAEAPGKGIYKTDALANPPDSDSDSSN